MLITAAIDPYGKWGPVLNSLLVGYRSNTPLMFNRGNPAAAEMYERTTTHPCPIGIIKQATKNWRSTKPTMFYGGSYSAPTPQEWFLQEFDLLIIEAFSIHLQRSGTRVRLNTYQQNQRSTLNPWTPTQNRAPPSFTIENSALLTFFIYRSQ